MNFLRVSSLKVLALYGVALLSVILIAQYIAIRYTLSNLTESERKIDFARSIQVQSQHIALQAEHYIQGNKNVAADLASRMDHQDYLLKTLSDGGRMEGSDLFLDPLSRLPKITYDNLAQTWANYKRALSVLIAGTPPINSTIALTSLPDSTADSTSLSDIVQPSQSENKEAFINAKLVVEAQWLSLSRWYDRLIEDLEEEVAGKQQAVMNWFSFFILLDIGGLGLIFFFFRNVVLVPLKKLELSTASQDFSDITTKNEIGAVAGKVNETIEDLRDATDFVIAIGEGKLDLDYKSLDKYYETGKNKLADSLIEMQAKLKALNEEERKRQWSNEGLAKFVDILRSSNDNLHVLGDSIIAALVQYTHSNQGGLYILNDEDVRNKYLELISLFAFDIKKYEQQKIKLGEGILGQTFLEKETTYLNDVPDSFVRITSGLGDANPRSVLMVPLKVDTQVYGIIELASFKEYSPHEIAFVEKLGESIASTLAAVRAAQKNRQLIEQFQQQTEEMRAQEEEMRQNMEELQATQEEIARKEKSYLARIQELEARPIASASKAELDSLKTQADRKEREYQSKIEELRTRLAEKPPQSDDWELAQEVEKALKMNLEALQITQEEVNRKAER